MAVNLTAIFRVRDQGTSRLRRITQMMEQMNRTSRTTSESMSRAQSATNRFGGAVSSASNRMGGFATRVTSLRVGADGLSASLRGMQGALVGIAGAYVGANGMAKLFNATIGEAAKFEQSKAVITAAFQDDNATKQYMKMVDKIAIDSPLLNSGDMFGSSKGLLTLSKNMPELENAWSIVERLIASDPTKSIDDAVRGLRELSSGDTQSLREVFNLDKNILNDVKGGSFEEQLKGLDKALNKMNISQKTVEAMGSTTLGRFNSMKERIGTFFRDMGGESNTKLGDFLKRINDSIDKLDVKSISDKLGSMLGKATDKAIALYDLFVKWRKPIAYAAGAIATFVAALAVVGTISALANPIALIAMGISAAAVGLKVLYDNSEIFRGAIDGIVGKVKTLMSAFKTGGTGGLINAIFPPDIAAKVNSAVDGIKTKISGLMTAFKEGGFRGVLETLISPEAIDAIMTRFATLKEQFISVFSSIAGYVLPVIQAFWTAAQPILGALWNALKIVADVAMLAWNNILAPAITFVMKAFTMLWAVVGPIMELMGSVIGAAFAVLRLVWDTIVGPFVAFLAGTFTQVFGAATEIVKALTPVFQTLGGWISTAAGYLKSFADILGKIKVPDWIGKIGSGAVSWAKKLIPGGGNSKPDGSHYHGLDNVRYDGYRAVLHKGEAVLNRQEADAYRNGQAGGGSSMPSINIAKMEVRKESDIQDIAYRLAKLIEEHRFQVGR